MGRLRHLEFDGRYMEAILSGRKRATVRLGRKPSLQPGDEVLLHCGGYVIGRAVVEGVETKTLRELDEGDAVLDGFSSRQELIEALKTHYARVEPESTAHIIRFRIVETPQKMVHSSEYAYEGNSPVEIAKNALEHLESLSEEERRILQLFLEKGSIRRAARKLGGMDKRGLIRDVLRRAYYELKDRGIMGPRL